MASTVSNPNAGKNELRPGLPDSVGGRFRLVRTICSTQATASYAGTDTRNSQPVYIRSVDPAQLPAGALLRIEHDAAILLDARPPGTIPLLHFGHEQGHFWLVSEWCDGSSLKSLVQSGGSLDVIGALQVAWQVADALEGLHQHGTVHTAINPNNVRIQSAGEKTTVRLVCPGTLDSLCCNFLQPDELLEAACFIPPEQSGVISDQVCEASDIYSLGCLLFFCLVGHSPYEAESLNELLLLQTTRPARELREMGLVVARVLDELLQRAVCRDLHSRYQTAAAVRFDLEELLAALGRGETDPHLVIGTRDRRGSLVRPAFVARHKELEVLDQTINKTRQGNAGVVFVEGPSGNGKTRLLSEFAIRCAQAGMTVMQGRATQDVGQPFQLLEGVAQGFVAACQAHPLLAEVVRERLQELTDVVVSALPGVAGVLPGNASAPVLDGPMGESRTLGALADFLSALGTPARPAVVILDDCQWADQLAYQLLLRWQMIRGRQTPGSRFVQIVVAFRSEEVPAESPLRRVLDGVHLQLGPLPADEITRLIESMAGPLPDQAAEAVTRLAEGNPFMASAILHGMVETGALVSDSFQWRINPAAFDIVRSSGHAAAFLSCRLDLLSDESRRLLSVGALLGTEFSLEMAIHLASLSLEEAWTAVSDARKRHLLWCQFNEGRCLFVHDKVREAFLERTSEEDRELFHRRAAEYLQAHEPDRSAELAYHYDAAGDHQAALPYARDAAEKARARHTLDVAEQQFKIAQRALGGSSGPLAFTVAEGLGDVKMLRGKYDEAERLFDLAASLADNTTAKAEVCGKRGELCHKRGDMEQAVAHFEEGLRLLGHSVPKGRLDLTLGLMWQVLVQILHTMLPTFFVGRKRRLPDKSERLVLRLFSDLAHACWYCRSRPMTMWAHLRGMNLGELYEPTLELAQSYSEHAPVMILATILSRGIKYAEKSLKIRRELGDLWGEGQSLHYYGVVLYAASRYDECIEKCRRAVQILERMGDYWQVHIARYQIAASLYRLGDLRGAVEESRRNYTSGIMLGDEQASGIILDVWARATAGRVDDEILKRESRRERHDAQGEAQVLLAEAVCTLDRRKPEDALEVLRRAKFIIERAGVQNPYTLPIYTWLATVWRLCAESDRSISPARRNYFLRQAELAARSALWQTWKCRNDLPHVLRECALLNAIRGRPAKARRLFDKSLQAAIAHGARYERSLTLSERARVGLELGWADAERDAETARIKLAEVQATDQEASPAPSSAAPVSLSLIDRFDTLLKTGRRIISALSKATIRTEVENAAQRLLRAERAWVVWVDEPPDSQGPDPGGGGPPIDRSLMQQAVRHRRVKSSGSRRGELASEQQSALCAPILVRGSVVACLYVVHDHLQGLFGPDEERIADFIATLAGAGFENAEGFAELGRLNATLEQRVADRTASLHERAEELVRSNSELERTARELRSAQERIVESMKLAEDANLAKSRFLAAMSHEIRTPMNGIIGMAELALATELSDRQRMYLTTVSQSAKALLAMLNDVLDFSKIEAGKMEVEFSPFALHETITESVRLLAVSAWQKGLDLTCRIAPDVPLTLHSDGNRLRQVLINLIGNAIKFTHEGSIDVQATLDHGDSGEAHVHLVVRDTGIGIPPHRQTRIFEPFDQGEASVTRRYGGTGLGLAISSQLVALMDGKIWLESEPGQGSAFHVVIPYSHTAENAEGRLQNKEGRSDVGETSGDLLPFAICHLPSAFALVFSRNPMAVASDCDTLRAWGMTVTGTTSPEEAKMLLCGPEEFGLVLIDISVKADEEIEFVRETIAARCVPESPSIREMNAQIVAIVPSGAERATARLQELGVSNILVKPLTPAALQQGLLDVFEPNWTGRSAPGAESSDRRAACARPLHILVADDSPINQEVAAGLLELLGHHADVVGSGTSALERLRTETFDAVFMDIEMPDMDGLTATRLLREEELATDRQTPVYAMSAHVLQEFQQECREAGMNGFISKPLQPEELREVLSELGGEVQRA